MTARIGFSLRALQSLDPAACKTDARLVWKDGERINIAIVQPRKSQEHWDDYVIQNLDITGARELRLLGLQMIRHAENMEREYDEYEVVLE